VPGAGPAVGIEITAYDPVWPRLYQARAGRIREALGWRVLQLEHVGSTSVPGLAAKPIIDIDLTVADPGRERDYVPVLEAIGFRLTIREPWWYGHRMLRADEAPRCNLHVFGFDSPEPVRHRILREWLRGNPGERDRYAAAKRQAASEANAGGEHVMQYNARKQQVIREIYHRAFAVAGLLDPPSWQARAPLPGAPFGAWAHEPAQQAGAGCVKSVAVPLSHWAGNGPFLPFRSIGAKVDPASPW
jgi:GrpB-like predicted nucleotidyltransferase (UPF0157 family)